MAACRKSTQPKFDPVKYSGQWYEFAKYPTLKYQNMCKNSTADYKWDSSTSTLKVVNTCFLQNGQQYSRSANAKIIDFEDPGKLSIEFDATEGPTDGKGQYWVHYTDYDNYAIVGGPSSKYLWILSRQPKLSKKEARWLIDLVEGFGYNADCLMSSANNISD